MFRPKVLEEVDSQYSGRIRVVSDFGSKYISTGFLTQSGGLVKEVWYPVLKKIAKSGKSWLILGLAGGTLARVIADRYSPSRLVGVEIDPVMLDLGRRHMNLGKIRNLEVVAADARHYLPTAPRFDYILVDMYFGDILPDFVYTQKFLSLIRTHLESSGMAVFNHLFYDPDKKSAAKRLLDMLDKNFSDLKIYRRLTNMIIVCR